jgi:hypothetical protein
MNYAIPRIATSELSPIAKVDVGGLQLLVHLLAHHRMYTLHGSRLAPFVPPLPGGPQQKTDLPRQILFRQQRGSTQERAPRRGNVCRGGRRYSLMKWRQNPPLAETCPQRQPGTRTLRIPSSTDYPERGAAQEKQTRP